jgi:hypothetical protein
MSPQGKWPAKNKYGNKKIVTPEGTFDSKREYNRYTDLMLLERAGRIHGLCRQRRFELIPVQRDSNGKLIERAVEYIADAVYTENGKIVVEDAKGVRTKEYIIKRKLLLYMHGIRIKEV